MVEWPRIIHARVAVGVIYGDATQPKLVSRKPRFLDPFVKSKPPEIVTVTKEVPTVITEKIPEPYEVKVYYPVASPIAKPPHGHCPSVADALNMFEFLQIDRRVDTLTEDK